MDYAVVNILDYIELIGEKSVSDVLSDFSCPKNKEIENFVHNNAVEFAKWKMSITYLLSDEYSRILAIFAITHKAVQIWGKNLSSTLQKRYSDMHKKMKRQMNMLSLIFSLDSLEKIISINMHPFQMVER